MGDNPRRRPEARPWSRRGPRRVRPRLPRVNAYIHTTRRAMSTSALNLVPQPAPLVRLNFHHACTLLLCRHNDRAQGVLTLGAATPTQRPRILQHNIALRVQAGQRADQRAAVGDSDLL